MRDRLPLTAVVLLSLSLSAAPARAEVQVWDFSVWVDERQLGSHRFEIAPAGAADHAGNVYTLASRADLEARFLFIKAFEYRHRSDERYENGCLRELHSSTVTGGGRYAVKANPEQDRLAIASDQDGLQAQQRVAGCLMSFAYWDKRMLQQSRLINSQTGRVVPVSIAAQPGGDFAGAPANAFEITSGEGAAAADNLQIRVWYHRDTGRWIGLESELDNGKVLRYVLQSADV